VVIDFEESGYCKKHDEFFPVVVGCLSCKDGEPPLKRALKLKDKRKPIK